MAAPTIRFPFGDPVPPTFAADGTCDPGSSVSGWLEPGRVRGATVVNDNTSWVIHFRDVLPGNYILEVEADSNPLFRSSQNVPILAAIVEPVPGPGRQPGSHVILPPGLDVRRPQRVALRGRTAIIKTTAKPKATAKTSKSKAKTGKSKAKTGKSNVRTLKSKVKTGRKTSKAKKTVR